MMTFTDLASGPSDPLTPFTDRLRLAVAAYLTRFKGSSREHAESDLRCYLSWCAERSLDPLAAQRVHLELYIRWMQEIRRFKPSTVSRRFSVSAGFYRTCALDGVLPHSPAEHVHRPSVPAESPRLGFTHCSSRPCSPPPGNPRTRPTSRWWPCSGCSACGSSRPPAPTSLTSARSTATGCCGCPARAPRSSLFRCRPRSAGPSTGQPDLLARLLTEHGATAEADPGAGLAVHGISAAGVGDLAARHGIALHQLVSRRPSLEEAFMELTRNTVDYRAHPAAAGTGA